MHQQLIVTDTEAAAIFYLYSIYNLGIADAHSPATGPLFLPSASAEFAALWEAGEPAILQSQ